MSGPFWKFSNGFTSLSNVSTILESHTLLLDGEASARRETLTKLLDENDLLQELLSNNSLLLEFLRDDEVLEMLFTIVINEGMPETSLVEDLDQLHLESDPETGTEKPEGDNGEEEVDVDLDNADESFDKYDSFDEDTSNADNDSESDEEKRIRHATLAAEILSADVWSLTDAVMESVTNLNHLWAVLDSKTSLSINLSTYFMKIMEHLLDMKCDEMITYLIDNQPTLVHKFINHLSNPPLMDFLLKLISTDKPDNSTGIIDFLQNQHLITHLIDSLDIETSAVSLDAKDQLLNSSEDVAKTDITEDSDNYDVLLVRQSSAADILKALITISANSTTDNSTIGPNELTRELVSHDQISRLCNIMLKGGYALANGVGIIIEIIRKNNSDYDVLPVLYITLESHPPTGRDPIYLGHLLHVFASNIDKFNKLLISHEGKVEPTLKTPFGEIEPLGFERFKICELIAELLHCSNMALLNDNKGFDVVKERDILRNKMKEFDPVSFKYNEVIVLPAKDANDSDNSISADEHKDSEVSVIKGNDDDYANDTIDSFNSRVQQDENSVIQHNNTMNNDDDEEEPHANANLSEEQIRAKPVIGDFLKISLYDTEIISNILSMFFKFPWNNFLHNVVFDIVQQVLNGSMDIGFNKFLAIDLFSRGDITKKIVEGQHLCSQYEANHNGLRLGFMGHLTLIAEEVVKFIQLYPVNTLSSAIDAKIEDAVWEEYVSHVLYDTREKYNAILGGGDGEEDEDDEGKASNTFDESDEMEEPEAKLGPALDPSIDHDITGSGYEGHEELVEDTNDEISEKKELRTDTSATIKSNSSDESESDDDDHFTNYMSQQLTSTASTDIVPSPTTGSKSDELEESSDDEVEPSDYRSRLDSTVEATEHYYDDYIDPNDDGMSYKNKNSLYDHQGMLKDRFYHDIGEEYSSEESSSSSSENEDEDTGVALDEGTTGTPKTDNKLTRAASKS